MATYSILLILVGLVILEAVLSGGISLRLVNLLNVKAALVGLCFALFIFITYIAVAALYNTARHEKA